MNLHFDQNLSHKLVRALADIYPGAEHVRELRLGKASDSRIWNYAALHQLIIVSKDDNFYQQSLLEGPPPKLVWLAMGNCSTKEIKAVLRRHRQDLLALDRDPEASLLILS